MSDSTMKAVRKIHLTDEQIRLYIKYLSGTSGVVFDIKTIEEIQAHLNDCEGCMAMVHERFKTVENKMETTSIAYCDEIDDNSKVFEVVRELKKLDFSDAKMTLLDSLLKYADDLDNNIVHIHMNTIHFGDHTGSRLTVPKHSDRFEYDKLSDISRGSDNGTAEENYMKIITSGKIKNKVEVMLNASKKQLTVAFKKGEYDYVPRVALLRIDDSSSEGDLRIADVLYNGAENTFEFKFENLEQGDYFVFIEPKFQV